MAKKVPVTAKFNYDFVELASRLSAAGFSQKDLGYAFGVSASAIEKWKQKYPSFKEAVNDGKKLAAQYLVAQGLRAAAGYEYTEKTDKYTKVVSDDNKEGELVLTESIIHHKSQPPNGGLLMFMLINISNGQFKNTRNVEVNQKSFSLDLKGQMEVDEIKRLAGKLDAIAGEIVENE